MELKVFQKENVSFTEMLEFLIKYLVLFDTSSLYSGKPSVAKLEDGDLYDTCFNTSSANKSKSNSVVVLSGGAELKNKKEVAQGEKLNSKKEEASRTNTNLNEKKSENKSNLIEERTRFNDKGFDVKSELFDLLNKGAEIIKNGIAYVLSFIAFASIYPAIPFFAVLAALYGILNWVFAKIKML